MNRCQRERSEEVDLYGARLGVDGGLDEADAGGVHRAPERVRRLQHPEVSPLVQVLHLVPAKQRRKFRTGVRKLISTHMW